MADMVAARCRAHAWHRWAGASIALALLGFGAGAAGPVAASAPPASDAGAGAPVGDAVPISPGVEWRAGAAGTYSAITSARQVAAGDGVRTDGTGFAEVAYTDGSRTRLDVNTEFEVVALVDDAGNATTRTVMGVGRTWHRVQSLGGSGGGFEVETSQAVAVVRGTAFLVSCPTVDSCDFTVMEGTVDVILPDGTVIPVVAPATVDVTNGVVAGPVPLQWDGLFGDPWLVANTDRDVDAGFADRVTVFEAHGPAYASMAGAFAVSMSVSDVTCVVSCDPEFGELGDTLEADLEFVTECAAGACALVGGAGVPYAFDGVTHTVTIPDNNFCYEDLDADDVFDDGEPITFEFPTSNDVAIAPSTAEVRGDAFVVTSFVYHRVTSMQPGTPCEGWFGQTITWDGAGTRV